MRTQSISSLLLGTTALLCLIGLIFIYSSSCVFALAKTGSAHYFLFKQMSGIFLGLVAAVIFYFIPLRLLRKLAPFLFLFSFGLTCLTLIPSLGITVHGSHRWLNAGFIIFQPSELLKIGFIVYLAYLLDKKQFATTSFSRGYLPLLCIVALACIIVLQQPDFGLAFVLLATAFLLFLSAQLPLSYLGLTALTAAPIIALLIWHAPYRLKRLATFLNPWRDPRGAGFQIIQSLIAIGSGGWFGVGIGHSRQKFFYLPMQHTDFIFSIIAEEVGFIGISFLISCYMLLLYCGIRLANAAKTPFAAYCILGAIFLITLQALMNIFVTTGLAPTKGIGLPFISYGKSAIFAHLCMISLILRCYTDQG